MTFDHFFGLLTDAQSYHEKNEFSPDGYSTSYPTWKCLPRSHTTFRIL